MGPIRCEQSDTYLAHSVKQLSLGEWYTQNKTRDWTETQNGSVRQLTLGDLSGSYVVCVIAFRCACDWWQLCDQCIQLCMCNQCKGLWQRFSIRMGGGGGGREDWNWEPLDYGNCTPDGVTCNNLCGARVHVVSGWPLVVSELKFIERVCDKTILNIYLYIMLYYIIYFELPLKS